MSSYAVSIFLNHSILIAAIIGIIRFKFISRIFRPFLFIIWLGLLNESLSLLIIYNAGGNTINSNVFVLLEYLLILLQFYLWNGTNKIYYVLAASSGIIVWLADNFILNTITQNNSVFRIFSSFVILLFSINQINKLIIYEHGRLI
ncbi:MAG: hypothetical protein ACRDE5_11025, partial [Ginsengibacter sp.]